MSATNSTTNYALPIFIGTDKPAWLVDWNSAMTAIDAAIKGVDTDVQGAVVDISGLSSTVASHTSSIATISGQITVITTNLNTATGNINTINSLIGNGTPTTTDQTLIGAINELHANQGDLADLTNPAVSLVAAINAISAGGAVSAAAVTYNNTASGLTATNVQAAIDEVVDDTEYKVLATVSTDGVKTMAQVLNELFATVAALNLSEGELARLALNARGSLCRLRGGNATFLSFTGLTISANLSYAIVQSYILQTSGSQWLDVTLNSDSSMTFQDKSVDVRPSGDVYKIVRI